MKTVRSYVHILLNLILCVNFLLISDLVVSNEKYKLEQMRNGVTLRCELFTLRITFCSDKIVHVICVPGQQIPEKKSLSVNRSWLPVSWKMEKKGDRILLKTEALTIEIDPATLLCRFSDSLGNLLLTEKERAFSPAIAGDESLWNIFQTFKLSPEEGIYGLGQHQNGWLNHRGKEITLIQTNTTAVNPFLISTKGWGILWDNYSKTFFRDERSNGVTFWSEFGDRTDYYFFAGANMDEVIAGYRKATGEAPMFGKWAYGFWQSRERYGSAKELTDVVAEYRMRRLPLDVIVQDWRYWGENPMWSSMEFDPKVYSEPEKTLEKLHTLYHVHYVISIWPALGRNTKIFKELNENGLIFTPVHRSGGFLYDAYNPQAQEIYWNYIREGLMSKGVDGLWMDATEPELTDQHTFEESEVNIKKLGNTALGPTAVYLNPYSLMATQGVYEKWRNDFPDKRVLILTRSAFAGQQRNAAITWSGDINASYHVFRRQISAGLNFCMAGIPYWTMDIGGFFIQGHDHGFGPGEYPRGCKDPSYKELYVRWFEFGAFCPVFRSHGTQSPREVWQFGEAGDWSYEAMKRFLDLRYRLLPYIYSVAWRVTSEGYTLMRALPMDFAGDKKVYDIDNQYMFGPSLMIVPVTEAQYFPGDTSEARAMDNADSVSLYLPGGTEWVDFWTGDRMPGGLTMIRSTPIDILPVYVKAGSIIPMGLLLQYSDEKPADPLEIRVYTGAEGSFTLYEDEGDNYHYESGQYSTINFSWDESTSSLTIGKRNGSYPGMLLSRTFNIVVVGPNYGTGQAITKNPEKIIPYSGEMIYVKFK